MSEANSSSNIRGPEGSGFQAFAWNYSGVIANILLQLVSGIILARLLGPEPFGVFAVCVLITSFAGLLVDCGLNAALIQSKSLSANDIGFAFFVQICIGFLISSSLYSSAIILSNFFNFQSGASVLEAMAALPLIQSLGSVSASLMRRRLQFKRYQITAFFSYFIAYLSLGMPLALNGYGVWSLVFSQIAQTTLLSGFCIYMSRQYLGIAFRPDNNNLINFGGKVLAINCCNWVVASFDSFAVGKYIGVLDLGLYSRSAAILSAPINSLSGAIQGVLLSSVAGFQTDIERTKKVYLISTSVLAIVALPICMTVSAVSETVVLAVYGSEWVGAAPILQVLALSSAVSALLALAGPVLTARNYLNLEMAAQVVTLLLIIPVVILAAQVSVVAVAWAVFAVSIVRLCFLLLALRSCLAVSFYELIAVIRWPLLAAIFTASATALVDAALSANTPIARLAFDILIAASALLLFVRVYFKRINSGINGSYIVERESLPRSLSLIIGKWYE